MFLRIPLLPWRTFRNRLLLFNLILTSILAKLVKPSIYLLLVAIAQRLLLTLMTPWRLLTPPSAWTAPTLLHASTSSTCVNSPSVRPSTPTSPSPPWYDLLVFCAPLCHHFVFRHLRPLGLGWGKATTFPTFDSKTLQSPVGCFDGFDQILKRWNLIVCGRISDPDPTCNVTSGRRLQPGSEKCDCIPCVAHMDGHVSASFSATTI